MPALTPNQSEHKINAVVCADRKYALNAYFHFRAGEKMRVLDGPLSIAFAFAIMLDLLVGKVHTLVDAKAVTVA